MMPAVWEAAAPVLQAEGIKQVSGLPKAFRSRRRYGNEAAGQGFGTAV
jgi:hypothetical protein